MNLRTVLRRARREAHAHSDHASPYLRVIKKEKKNTKGLCSQKGSFPVCSWLSSLIFVWRARVVTKAKVGSLTSPIKPGAPVMDPDRGSRCSPCGVCRRVWGSGYWCGDEGIRRVWGIEYRMWW